MELLGHVDAGPASAGRAYDRDDARLAVARGVDGQAVADGDARERSPELDVGIGGGHGNRRRAALPGSIR